MFLDNDERRNYVSKPLEYLIEQVQVIPAYPVPTNTAQLGIPLVLNHPLKEIIWVFRRNIMESWHE